MGTSIERLREEIYAQAERIVALRRELDDAIRKLNTLQREQRARLVKPILRIGTTI